MIMKQQVKTATVIIPNGCTPINLGYNEDGNFIWFYNENNKNSYKELPIEVHLRTSDWSIDKQIGNTVYLIRN